MQSYMASARQLRILVADDIEASRRHLCRLVRLSGHEVHGVANGTAALAYVVEQAPDLVLLDLLMPDMDGFEVTQKLRTLVTDRWLPVIVTSSLEGEEHFVHALKRGADDYLSRPISPVLLDAKLRHYAGVLGLQSRLAVLARRQRDIHDNILDAVITMDGNGKIEESNLAAVRAFGNGTDRLVGQNCAAVLSVPLADLLGLREMTLSRSDGTLFPAELALSQWTEASRVHYTMVIRDLTEQHRIDRMKGEFLATVSHELRTPLTSVLGALGLMASGAAGELPRAAIPLADVAKRNGERLSRLIDDILDLTKLEGNQMVLHLRQTGLDGLLQEALNANMGYAQRSGVRLDLQIQPDSPRVRVDADRFLQIMANLLSNAIKHSTTGDTVSVSLEWTTDRVRIKVRDHGPGIDPEFRAHMFEKFSQADGSDRRTKGGTGLGLYITRVLVQRMGGRVDVDSVPDQGATFWVELPVAGSALPLPTPWLLHIDNDLDARRRVAEWASSLCRVESAADLAQAQALLHGGLPPVIIADPQAQGAADEFCALVQKMAPGRPVVLFSDAVDAAFVGCMGMEWLQKSHTGRDDLVSVLQSALVKAAKEPKP